MKYPEIQRNGYMEEGIAAYVVNALIELMSGTLENLHSLNYTL